MIKIFFLAIGMFLVPPAYADLQVRFDEGAPKDRFSFSNVGECDIGSTTLSIDLSGSPYGLIFDVTGTGAGVEVFQPFEVVDGSENLRAMPLVQDGDNQVSLELVGLKPGETLAFTIDVDDTKNNREITVSNSEFTGTRIVAKTEQETSDAFFEETTVAEITLQGCGS